MKEEIFKVAEMLATRKRHLCRAFSAFTLTLIMCSCQESGPSGINRKIHALEGVAINHFHFVKGGASSVYKYYAVLETTEKGFENLCKAFDLKPTDRLMLFSMPGDSESTTWWTPPASVKQLKEGHGTWYSGFVKGEEVAGRSLGVIVWRDKNGVVFFEKTGSSLL